MQEIKTAAIMGLGAVGAYFLWGLADKMGENLSVIAQGERAERLKKEGIEINGKTYYPNVKSADEVKGVDLLLVAVKYGALKDSLDEIERATGENTTVLSLMNGVNTEEIIAERIGEEHMLYSMMKISSERKGRSVVFKPEATPGMYFGERGINEPTERVRAVMNLLDGTGVNYVFCEDIMQAIWDKFALNVSNNLPQAIIGCGVGAYHESEYAGKVYMSLRNEVADIAAAQGIEVSREPDDAVQRGISKKSARYSTLQDIDAKRHTEVDMLAGIMIELGRKYGVPTPYSEVVYYLIKAIEEKNDGKFDYE